MNWSKILVVFVMFLFFGGIALSLGGCMLGEEPVGSSFYEKNMAERIGMFMIVLGWVIGFTAMLASDDVSTTSEDKNEDSD